MSSLDPFRAAGPPMLNDNKLRLGIFGSSCSNASATPLAETSFELAWEKNLEATCFLETAGLERMGPIARWRGFGGPSNFNGNCMGTDVQLDGGAGRHNGDDLPVRDLARFHAAPDRRGRAMRHQLLRGREPRKRRGLGQGDEGPRVDEGPA